MGEEDGGESLLVMYVVVLLMRSDCVERGVDPFGCGDRQK